MRHFTITHWELKEGAIEDDMIRRITTEFFDTIRGYGAEDVRLLVTGTETLSVLTVYPDEDALKAARGDATAIREKAKTAFRADMTGSAQGQLHG